MLKKLLSNGGGKKLLIGILVGILVGIMLMLVPFFATRKSPETNVFNEYLDTGNFNSAYTAFKSIEGQYHEPLNSYMESIIDKYNNSDFTYDEAETFFSQLENSGFSSELTADYKTRLASLNESKKMFETATNLYSEKKHSEAKDYYAKVASQDTNYDLAQEKITEIDTMLQTSINDYAIANELYSNHDIDKALENYQIIVDKGVNTEDAEGKIAKIQDVASAWETEFADDTYDRCSYPFGVAAKADCIYLPYSYNNSYAIVKYNLTDETTEIFKLTEMAGNLIVKDINIIGDYLYFVAGENIGTGRTYTNPYNIYRMKDDGTELECVALGDYINLIVYKDGFYASSYSLGLLKLDKNLKYIETICESAPEQMQLVEDKLYYTVAEYTPSDMIHAQYVYDGKTSEKVKQNTLLRFGFYSGIELYAYKAYEYYEKLFFSDKANDIEYALKFSDVKDSYGLVGSNILHSAETTEGKIDYYVYSLAERVEKEYTFKIPKNVTSLNSIYFEKEIIIFSTDSGFILADSDFNVIKEIDSCDQQIEQIKVSNDISFNNEPTYTDTEVVVVEDKYRHYSNNTYHITIEQQYLTDVDASIHIAHIRTTDPEGIYIDSPADDTHLTLLRINPQRLSRRFSAVLACNGDFFDEPANAWTGISIRDGIVYKKMLIHDMMAIYPGGELVCHSAEENIRYEDLLYAGVRDTLSFGPILLSDGEYGNDIYTNFLSMDNPRCSLGMVEPGHYVIILADGRQPNSSGVTLKRLADLFIYEGCKVAYNLDGGQSAAMMFMGEYVNTHKNDYTGKNFRAIGEIVYFGTSDLVPDE